MIKTIELSTASQPLADYAEDFRDKTVVLTLNGRAFAAVVSLKELDLESSSLSENPEFMKIIEQAREEFATGKRVSLAEMKREMLG
jgi:PHD/YefM family antitoxin component YafN of YafNO toxin-antitoxin module